MYLQVLVDPRTAHLFAARTYDVLVRHTVRGRTKRGGQPDRGPGANRHVPSLLGDIQLKVSVQHLDHEGEAEEEDSCFSPGVDYTGQGQLWGPARPRGTAKHGAWRGRAQRRAQPDRSHGDNRGAEGPGTNVGQRRAEPSVGTASCTGGQGQAWGPG